MIPRLHRSQETAPLCCKRRQRKNKVRCQQIRNPGCVRAVLAVTTAAVVVVSAFAPIHKGVQRRSNYLASLQSPPWICSHRDITRTASKILWSSSPTKTDDETVSLDTHNGVFSVTSLSETNVLAQSVVTNNNGVSHQNGVEVETATNEELQTPINGASSSSETLYNNVSATLCDIPTPTEFGGYTHTVASKAKISAANKGKTPWNKGKTRSEEVKARIAAGVRAKNRERFLKKLEDMGVTEDEYEIKRKDERRAKDAERRARKTANGGYRPTEETKAKISKILKEKWANGEVKQRAPINPANVRRGFTHTEETKQKIRDSLKKRWAEDPEYRQRQVEKATKAASEGDVRTRIGQTLKEKWKDPEFRSFMMEKISNRRKPEHQSHNEEHRRSISDAMKAKWQDPEYRAKAMEAMEKRRAENPPAKPRKARTEAQKAARQRREGMKPPVPRRMKKAPAFDINGIAIVEPVTAATARKSRASTRRKSTPNNEATLEGAVEPLSSPDKKRKRASPRKKKGSEPDGSISRLREERRDLYDLLYGDDDDEDSSEKAAQQRQTMDAIELERKADALLSTGGTSSVSSLLTPTQKAKTSDRRNTKSLQASPASPLSSVFNDVEDEDLDDFDPYGLENE
eukprot:scaffold1983_cov45-Attheya_sp.AAC.2